MQLGTSKALIQASAPDAYHPNPHKLEIFRSTAAEPSHWCVGDRCFFRTPRCHEHPQGACSSSSGSNQHGPASSLPLPLSTRAATDDHRSSPVLARGLMRSHGKVTRMGVKRTLRLDQSHAEFERPMGVVGRAPSPDTAPGADVAADELAAERFGVVRSLDCKDQTVYVSWLKPATTCPLGAVEAHCRDETVSAFIIQPPVEGAYRRMNWR
ncbi:hypothetical protein C2845_PM01G32380 [Panicum miliaceum]|uniref:UBE2O-like SH3-B domain-containing protein n=1 Tax=Panicum miliaceum TaxID=4540 RepID=A0A3L6THJ3_PANMI|nr:hypothetical protein C2845_PM01G32380 [Panicum miliaceum]